MPIRRTGRQAEFPFSAIRRRKSNGLVISRRANASFAVCLHVTRRLSEASGGSPDLRVETLRQVLDAHGPSSWVDAGGPPDCVHALIGNVYARPTG